MTLSSSPLAFNASTSTSIALPHFSERGKGPQAPKGGLASQARSRDDLDEDVAGSVHITVTFKFTCWTVEVLSAELLANVATGSTGDGQVLLCHSDDLGPCLDSLGFRM